MFRPSERSERSSIVLAKRSSIVPYASSIVRAKRSSLVIFKRNKAEAAMSCTLLDDKYIFLCFAGKNAYVPSEFELSAYCTGSRYARCPFFMRSRSETETNASDLLWSEEARNGSC
jgi:hypothetical protein